jgi:hypothetical protein
LKNLITYFGFLAKAHSLKPPTLALEGGKIVGINGGVDFSFKQHSMTTTIVYATFIDGLPISMSSSMSCVIVKREVVMFVSMAIS